MLPKPGEIKIKKKSKVKSNYPPQKKTKPKSKLGLYCCSSATGQVVKAEKAEEGTMVSAS